jgi:hypothetical protein
MIKMSNLESCNWNDVSILCNKKLEFINKIVARDCEKDLTYKFFNCDDLIYEKVGECKYKITYVKSNPSVQNCTISLYIDNDNKISHFEVCVPCPSGDKYYCSDTNTWVSGELSYILCNSYKRVYLAFIRNLTDSKNKNYNIDILQKIHDYFNKYVNKYVDTKYDGISYTELKRIEHKKYVSVGSRLIKYICRLININCNYKYFHIIINKNSETFKLSMTNTNYEKYNIHFLIDNFTIYEFTYHPDSRTGGQEGQSYTYNAHNNAILNNIPDEKFNKQNIVVEIFSNPKQLKTNRTLEKIYAYYIII